MGLNDSWPSIDPGRFRHQVALLVPVTSSGIAGNQITYESPVPAQTAMVEFIYLRGQDIYGVKSDEEVSQVFVKVISWWRDAFTPNNRLQTLDGETFIIKARENVARMGVYMVLTCVGLGANN
jgi:hypothetical protein